MKRWWILALTLPLTACTALFAQAISSRVSDDLLSLESYSGELIETGLLPDPTAELKKRVLYQKPWKVRVEVEAPAERAGDLYVYDGQTLTLWWPKELFGVRVHGVPSPGDGAIRAHLKRETDQNLAAYAFNLVGEEQVAGAPCARWKVLPKDPAAPYRMEHESWMHADYSIPLRMSFRGPGAEEGAAPWYAMRYTSFQDKAAVPPDAFALSLPKNAVVFEWDWSDEGITLAAARETMNFTLRLPKALPEGFQLSKIVRGRHDLPMVSFRLGQGGTWLSLTENRNYAGQLSMPVGRKVKLGEVEGYLNFMGPFAVLSWALGDCQLTLIGNLSFPQLLEIARGVE